MFQVSLILDFNRYKMVATAVRTAPSYSSKVEPAIKRSVGAKGMRKRAVASKYSEQEDSDDSNSSTMLQASWGQEASSWANLATVE
ncbi:hypothetical protein DVJ77_18295 [Dyella tabacisoli]|uniref:Uncharacterized protein n=1 Tax=Dyella tabacisoli TaxID=2282381 RepID=A0A369UI79_9GAMM|nr:hypothetical protein DVJ77_18295 [Dyella tabacisoli]